MTEKNPKKPQPTKSGDLAARVSNAALFKFSTNATDAEVAKTFNISVHTIADWKKRPEWAAAVASASEVQMAETFNEMRAMAPAARETLFELMRSGPPTLRAKVAQFICEWAIKTHLD